MVPEAAVTAGDHHGVAAAVLQTPSLSPAGQKLGDEEEDEDGGGQEADRLADEEGAHDEAGLPPLLRQPL